MSAITLVVICGAAAIIHPDLAELRIWSAQLGPWFPLIFLLVHALVTIAPFPRTVFTVSSALLFPAWLAIGLSVGASTISAVIALLIIRGAARDLATSYLRGPMWMRASRRLARRGWLAVGSLRLIGALPFFAVNAAAAVSPVRVLPYALASIVGMLPGTALIVLVTVGLTTGISPVAVAIPLIMGCVGVVGLFLDVKMDVPESAEEHAAHTDTDPATENPDATEPVSESPVATPSTSGDEPPEDDAIAPSAATDPAALRPVADPEEFQPADPADARQTREVLPASDSR